MGKGLAITGFILSLAFFLGFAFNFYWFAWFSIVLTIIGFIINLIVLIKGLDGKKFAFLGLILNFFVLIIGYIMPYYFG